MPQARLSHLDAVHQMLTDSRGQSPGRVYRIPALWNCWGYDEVRPSSRRGEILVDPYRFFVDCLRRVILPARGASRLAGRTLSQVRGVRRLRGGQVRDGATRRRGGDWLRGATIYAMLVRTSTAWDHDGDGRLDSRFWTETGTFLKSIVLLPLLSRMGVDVVYLLPVSKVSRAFRKGEVGCPYSAKNFFELEPELHDRLLGPAPDDHVASSLPSRCPQYARKMPAGATPRGAARAEARGSGPIASGHPSAQPGRPCGTGVRACETIGWRGRLARVLRPPGGARTMAGPIFSQPLPPVNHRRDGGATGVLGPTPSVQAQFAAFVETAHALGIRVMVDLAPRTAARDNDLILEHPDWFYWIDARSARRYGAPRVEGYEPCIPRPAQLRDILRRDVLRAHLAKFRHAPNVAAPAGWQRFVRRYRRGSRQDPLRSVIREFGLVTPPGFSDVMNDPQPPWTDVTYLRLFLDHPVASARHLDDPTGQPPYVFTDTAKAGRFPGRRPNRPLWRLLADILPFYQRFGVDGARVDMGHALPTGLQQMVIDQPRRRDPDFGFLAEELSFEGAASARRAGYNALIGASWHMQPRHGEGQLHKFVHQILPSVALPVLAAAETPDTPRAATRNGGRRFVRLIAVLNNFLPSAVPFINSGLEVFERQPMNEGLDVQAPGRLALPRGDPYRGKLAYFDRVALHWASAGAAAMVDLLGRAAELRRRFLADLVRPENYFQPDARPNGPPLLTIGWQVESGRSALIVAANLDFVSPRECRIENLRTNRRAGRPCQLLPATGAARRPPTISRGTIRLRLAPGEIQVVLV